jgi:transcriptional regulator with XRE-family HTH domain
MASNAKKPNDRLRFQREKRGWSQRKLADELSTSEDTISRWERGERKPSPYYQERLCKIFERDAEELGFINTTAQLDEAPLLTPTNDNKISRRQASREIGGIIGSALLANRIPLFDETDVLDRLLKVVKRPSSIDMAALTQLETMTRNYWQLYARFENSIQYRYDMLPSVSGHLQTVTRLLEHPQPTNIQNILSSVACETTQLIGEIFFDLKDNETAERYYNASIELARETQNDLSLAITLGRKSFIPIYSDDPQKALPFLQEAYAKLTGQPSDIIRAWLAAREAEVHAKLGNANACYKALEQSEYYLEKAQPGETSSYAFTGEAIDVHFTRSLLLGYKGACYTRLKQPEAAQAALTEDIASIDPSRSIHNAIVLVDLARTYIQQGEIEEACRLATQALMIMVQLQSARVFQRLLDLRSELETWKNTEYVSDLDQRMAMLPHIM